MAAFWASLIFVVLAEMGDKTQLLAMAFATRYKATTVLRGVFVATALNHLAGNRRPGGEISVAGTYFDAGGRGSKSADDRYRRISAGRFFSESSGSGAWNMTGDSTSLKVAISNCWEAMRRST